ncbi:hypothetical protein M2360_000939 [Rhizobium sp. SG_E_25_P2]|uniref:hypothetical protein n=1 Tax=Rhizobium sp. SG_E_25_P2 TaxID=2879942 RepID=UPI0024753257|nr:hypothetical protein [Rhizobium sp. SG_E_25_P2]MDH6265549.1 hypothetical protein [Rhizobium sp. SG_E_25_P2]
MAQQPTYNDGTVTVGAGATTVTGVGTAWTTYVKAGDYFWAQGRSVRIATVNSATQLTLAYGWPGDAISAGNYEIIYTPAQQVAQAKTTALLGQLSNGNLSSIAGLTTAANKLSYYTGVGVAALADFSAFGRSLVDDADQVAARTTLGLVLTTSATDATAGRVLKYGDFGVGTPLPTASGVDYSSFSTSTGFIHNSSTSNAPSDVPGSGESWYGFAANTSGGGRGAQLLIGNVTGRAYVRGHTSGAYTSWGELAQVERAQTLINKTLTNPTINAATISGTIGGGATFSGALSFDLPPRLPSYTVSTLPSASAYSRGLIYVSNGASNKRLAISDGTAWRFPDGAVVS